MYGGGYGGSYGGNMYGNSMYNSGYGGLYGGSGMYGGSSMYGGGGAFGRPMGYGGMGMGMGMGMGPYGNPDDPNNPFGPPTQPPSFWVSFLRVVSFHFSSMLLSSFCTFLCSIQKIQLEHRIFFSSNHIFMRPDYYKGAIAKRLTSIKPGLFLFCIIF
jgi:hypothetical protein